jgi:hypothetical protein
MQWSDVTKAPPPKMLRQFAGLWLVVFGGFAAWRVFGGRADGWTWALAIAAVVVGLSGLARPSLVRPIFTGWMIAAFPIGWTISKVVLGALFYLVFTPVGMLFRLVGRDALKLRRGPAASHWVERTGARSGKEYLRQF